MRALDLTMFWSSHILHYPQRLQTLASVFSRSSMSSFRALFSASIFFFFSSRSAAASSSSRRRSSISLSCASYSTFWEMSFSIFSSASIRVSCSACSWMYRSFLACRGGKGDNFKEDTASLCSPFH